MANPKPALFRAILIVMVGLCFYGARPSVAQDAAPTPAATAEPTQAATPPGNTAPPVTVVVFREAETVTLYIADQDVVSLDGLTLESVTVQGDRLKIGLDEFPAFRGLDLTRIVGPACFQLISNQRTSSLPLECRKIPPSHLVTQKLTPANMIWYDSIAQEACLLILSDGKTVYGQCPATAPECEIPYSAPLRPVNVPTAVPLTDNVIPISGQAVVNNKTAFRAGPGPQYDVVATVSAGTYTITGKDSAGSYYRLDYNGKDVWVTAFAQTITFQIVDVSAEPTPNSVPLDAKLTYNEPVDSKLGKGEKTNYTFVGIAGETVSIVVEGQFDSFLQLFDPKGDLLVEDDNSGGNGNPRIDSIRLPRNGEYRVVLRGYTANDAGIFRLTVYKGKAPEIKASDAIKYGQKITAYLAPNGEGVWNFQGAKGDVISIVVQANFTCYIQLQDANQSILASDDGSGLEGNPLISSFELPAAGQYRIVLRGENPNDAGTYSVNLLTSVADNVTKVRLGMPVTSMLPGGGQVVFTFDASAGDRVTITVDADFKTRLSLRDERGAVIAEDSGADAQGALIDIELPAKSTYYLVVSGGTASDQGAITVTVTKR